MIHPYFVWKARAVFRAAGGDPGLSGELAAWAQTARAAGDPDVGVIVSASGALLARTRYVRSGYTGATYVVASQHSGVWELEAGLAVSRLTASTDQACVLVRYSEVCQGSAPAAERLREDKARALVRRVNAQATGSGEVIRLSDLEPLGPVEDANFGHLATQEGYFVLPTAGQDEEDQVSFVLGMFERAGL